MRGQFRFAYNSDKYDETVAFYRDGLQLSILDSWDAGPEARGSVFQAAAGFIEVMEHPATHGDQWAVYSPDLPKTVGLAFEVENVDELYQSAREKKLPIKTDSTTSIGGNVALPFLSQMALSFCLFYCCFIETIDSSSDYRRLPFGNNVGCNISSAPSSNHQHLEFSQICRANDSQPFALNAVGLTARRVWSA